MSRREANRQETRINRRVRRGLEVVFWITFALAIMVGGPGALAGLPKVGDLITPSGVLEAQASAEKRDFVSIPINPFTPPLPEPSQAPAAKKRYLPAIAIVIDDLGHDVEQNRRAITLPKPVSLSFLPYPAATPMLVREAKRAGHEILVHVPMEAPSDRDGSLEMALRREYSREENIRRLDWALMRVRGYTGINNHEGSVFTQDRRALVAVAEALYARGVFFLDSRTTPNSQVVPVARAFGVPSSDRDVFLDDDKSSDAVAMQLKVLERTARSNGVAIAIGHPHKVTLDLITRWCAEQSEFKLVSASTAIRMKTERAMGIEVVSSE